LSIDVHFHVTFVKEKNIDTTYHIIKRYLLVFKCILLVDACENIRHVDSSISMCVHVNFVVDWAFLILMVVIENTIKSTKEKWREIKHWKKNLYELIKLNNKFDF
jgi:hypothetical protein